MNIALIGYGKMGHAIAELAPQRGHRIVCTIDSEEQWAASDEALAGADVAVEFTTPSTAVGNLKRCFALGLPVVCGTTGWYDRMGEVEAECQRLGGALFVASNFSIGMNLMFALNRRLAELMRGREEYRAAITETHHVHKLDAPSGTAVTLQAAIREVLPSQEVPITSVREGEVPGTHTVGYTSNDDVLLLTHCARSRKGLATGALLAAEYLPGKTGLHTMSHLLNLGQ